MEEQIMTTGEVAELTGLPASTLEQWRCRGKGPKFLKLGRRVRYRRSDVETFLEENTFRSNDEAKKHSSKMRKNTVSDKNTLRNIAIWKMRKERIKYKYIAEKFHLSIAMCCKIYEKEEKRHKESKSTVFVGNSQFSLKEKTLWHPFFIKDKIGN